MSAVLLGLAFKAEAPSPVAKLVLLKLVDCCDDEGRNIFPAVATVARAAMCEPRTVRRVLETFCDVGLLRKVREGGYGRGSTACYELSVERLALLAARGWAAMQPFARAGERARGEADGDADGLAGHDVDACEAPESTPMPCENKGDTESPLPRDRVTSAPVKGDTGVTQPLKHIPLKTEREGACARDGRASARHGTHGRPAEAARQGAARQGASSAVASDPDLDVLIRLWPAAALEDLGAVRAAWADLPFGMRATALRRAPVALDVAKRENRKHLGKLARWLSERNFAYLPDPEAQAPAHAAAAPRTEDVCFDLWSRSWWAMLIAKRHLGERYAFDVSHANERRSGAWTCKASLLAHVPPEALRPFRADSAEAAAWIAWLEERDTSGRKRSSFNITNPERLWLFAPCETPDGLKDWMAGQAGAPCPAGLQRAVSDGPSGTGLAGGGHGEKT